MKSKRFTRRERRRLNEQLIEACSITNDSVKLIAADTDKSIPLDPTSPENIEHWFKYSFGSWRKRESR